MATRVRKPKGDSIEQQALATAGNEDFEQINNLDYTRHCMGLYGKQTIENRAIPDYRDGLIPVQRRTLYAMYRLGNTDLVKSARVVGEVLGKWHPHGDTAAYGSMATLVQAPIKLIEGSGNWGSYDDPKAFAAMRYTECRLSNLSRRIFFNGYLPKVYDLIPNFDGSEVEPAVLHCNIPVLLVLGKLGGIAVGATCNFPSFTLESVAELTKLALEGKKITPKMCRDILEFNFAWGGVVSEVHERDGNLDSLYKEGSASLTFRSDYELDEKAGTLTIKSIPPNANYEKCIEKTAALGFGVNDLTTVGSDGLEIVINLKKTRAYQFTKDDIRSIIKVWTGVTVAVRCAITDRQMTKQALLEGASGMDISFTPTIGIADFIMKWAKYRLGLEVQMATSEKKDLEVQISKLDLIILARENFDKIKKALDAEDPISYTAKALKIDMEDAKYIMSRTLIQLSKTDIDATQNKIAELKKQIKACNARIKNPISATIDAVDYVLG